jgi:glutamyl-tRNA synthetase
MELAQSRVERLSDLPDLAGFLLKGDLGLTADNFRNIKKVTLEDAHDILQTAHEDLEKIFEWNAESIEAELREVAERMEKKLRIILAPLFIAVSGSSRSLPLFDSMALMGRSVVRQRLKQAVKAIKLGLEEDKKNNG